jgi:CCR4-NOT transcription complex subunit 9
MNENMLQAQQQQQAQQAQQAQQFNPLAPPAFDPALVQLVLQLTDSSSERREQALTDLSKQRETFPDLAPMLWHSCGTIAALLQEIISIYPALSPPTLSVPASNRVCNALALLQCVASHPDTRAHFLQGALPRDATALF